MSNETTTAVERGSSALSKHPLYGCGCCSDPETYDVGHPDGCPREDGWTEHDYSDDCWKERGRSAILAADVLTAAIDVEEISDAIATARHYGVRLKPDQANYLARVIRDALLGTTS
jgi:hypothetical protein